MAIVPVKNEKLLRATGFGKAVDLRKKGICPLCQKKVNIHELRDFEDKEEHRMSGMCQACIDKTFGR